MHTHRSAGLAQTTVYDHPIPMTGDELAELSRTLVAAAGDVRKAREQGVPCAQHYDEEFLSNVIAGSKAIADFVAKGRPEESHEVLTKSQLDEAEGLFACWAKVQHSKVTSSASLIPLAGIVLLAFGVAIAS